jgi:hypothetical protein
VPRQVGAAVEDGDGTVLVAAGVVLEVGTGALSRLEVAPLAAQAPQDSAALAVDLVNGPRVAGRDERFPSWSTSVELMWK